MKTFKKLKLGALSGLMAIAFLVVTSSTAFAGFFPANRPTYQCITPTNCVGADHVTFNSFTNNPVVGDERPFFAGSLNSANVQDRIKVQDDDVIVLRAFVHNNADPNLIGKSAAIARNVKIRVLVPSAKQDEHNLVAFITAANSSPKTINDTMSLHGDRPFTLDYIEGSANFKHKPAGTHVVNDKLNDIIVSGSGTSLGDIHGCFKFSGFVTLKVKVDMDKIPPPPEKPPEQPPEVPPEVPEQPEKPQPERPKALPVTGPGAVFATFLGVSSASALLHRIFTRRQF